MQWSDPQALERLLQRSQQHERRARRNALLLTVLPILMALLLLSWTTQQVTQALTTAEQAEAAAEREHRRADTLGAEVASLEEKLVTVQARLADATALGKFVHPIDFVDLKAIASRNRDMTAVLQRILALKEDGVDWQLGGTRPEQGFDSPSFAAFVLRQVGAPIDLGDSEQQLLQRSRELFERLPAVERPEPGDLLFYPSGYVLFYFVDADGRPFVIGMTPLGITALKPAFAEVLGIRRWRG